MLFDRLETILDKVQKPARYIGGELHSVVKDPETVDVRFAFCFPDLYEIGMSHLGMKILYSLKNAREDIWCERVFAPAPDMESLMREKGIPLYGLESLEPVAGFDFIGFTLQYELCYTAVLNMLDLAGLPVRSADRKSLAPIVMAGGPCACNPEPLADFVDLFVLGEGEEVNLEMIDLYQRAKAEGWDKGRYLREAARIPGIYVPSLYEVAYNGDGTVAAVTPREGAPSRVTKRIVAELDKAFFPDRFVVPYIEIVHDRSILEVLRGCLRGCRFCQAGFLYRPFREKRPGTLGRNARALCMGTGYDEVSLTSLSTSDYSGLEPLLGELLSWTEGERVNLSLPSLRADNFSPELLAQIARVRKSGLTFAPEAGTQRLRDAINKNVTEEEVLRTCRTAFAGGYTSVKLYFMLGLPTETMEDVAGIAELAQKVVEEFYRMPDKPKGKGVNVTISAACFVPKPFTPFEFEPQDTVERFREKQTLLKESIRSKKIRYKYHDSGTSVLEAVLARGDRRLCAAVEYAWRAGSRLDGWDEYFSMERWTEAFEAAGIDPAFYAHRRRDYAEVMPWSHLDYGVNRDFLINENRLAHSGAATPNCRESCSGCGAAGLFGGGEVPAPCGPAVPGGETSPVTPAPPPPVEESAILVEQMPMARVFFEKTGRARYTSHLDVMRMLTRALRRSGLPLWYTQGFNPHLYMTFALPIALGCESLCESVDLRLTREMEYSDIVERVNAVLPPGFRALRAAAPERDPGRIAWADYRVRLLYPEAEIPPSPERLEEFLAQPAIEVIKRSKKGEKRVDLKPLTALLEAAAIPGGLELRLRCAAGNTVNIAPPLLLGAFADWSGTEPGSVRILREAVLCDDLQPFC